MFKGDNVQQQKQKVIEPAKKPIRRKQTTIQKETTKQIFPDECEFPYSMYKRNYISEEQRNGHTHR